MLLAEFPAKDLEGDDLDSSYDAYLFQQKYKTLQTNIIRIKDFLDSLNGEGANTLTNLHKLQMPIFSLAEAIIAIASSRHFLSALKSCRTYIDKVIPASQSSYTDLFFNSQEALILELEDFILIPHISKFLKIDWINTAISTIKWDEKKEDQNQYVNRLVHLIDDFKDKLGSIGGGSIPHGIQGKVLGKAAKHCQEQIIEAFGKVKRCNLPGREQMMKDFKVFIIGLNNVIETSAEKEYEQYIEVWNHSAEQIYEWIRTHTNFSLRLQKSLFNTAPLVASLNKTSRNQLFTAVENLYRQKLND